MLTLAEARELVGHPVRYRPSHGKAEEGVISSVNDRHVFVRFGVAVIGQACRPEDLQRVIE